MDLVGNVPLPVRAMALAMLIYARAGAVAAVATKKKVGQLHHHGGKQKCPTTDPFSVKRKPFCTGSEANDGKWIINSVTPCEPPCCGWDADRGRAHAPGAAFCGKKQISPSWMRFNPWHHLKHKNRWNYNGGSLPGFLAEAGGHQCKCVIANKLNLDLHWLPTKCHLPYFDPAIFLRFIGQQEDTTHW